MITAVIPARQSTQSAESVACDEDGIASQAIQGQVRQIISHRLFTKSDAPDVEQELRFELWRRWPAFDSSRASQATFIRRVLKHRGVSLVRARLAAKRDLRRNECSLNALVRDADGNFIERSQTVNETCRHAHQSRETLGATDLVSLRLDCRDAVDGLPDDLRRLCQVLSYCSISEAARELEISRQKIYAAIARIRTLFEDRGLSAYVGLRGQRREFSRMENNSQTDHPRHQWDHPQ